MKKGLCLTFIFLLVTTLASAADKDALEISYAHMNALETPIHKWSVKFKELVEEKSGGKIIVNIHPAGQLGSDAENFEGLMHGTINMCANNSATISGIVPEWGVFNLPFLFNSYEHVEAVMDGEVGTIADDIVLEQKKVRNLAWIHNGFRDMMTVDKPIKTFDDFAGVKFRSPPFPAYVLMFEAIGAKPTPIPWTEVYSAMKSKMADGMETVPLGMWGAKMYEVTKYVTVTHHLYTANNILINEDFYQGLSDENRMIIDEAAKEAEAWGREYALNYNADIFDKLKGAGLTIIDLDPAEKVKMQKACEPVWEKLAEETKTPMVLELAKKAVKAGS